MLQLSAQKISHSFGGQPLLDNVTFQVHKGDKISLIGRNGSGKSTLMKLIQGEFPPDAGLFIRPDHVSISSLPQNIPEGIESIIFDEVAKGLGEAGELLAQYHKTTVQMAQSPTEDMTRKLSAIQHSIEVAGGWDMEKRVEKVLTLMDLKPDVEFSTLSSGMKRRVLLAKSLVTDPKILLLDEPTNHLDIDSIIWMENFFKNYAGTIIFVTHDRVFLRKLATRIIEIDRGNIVDWACDYDTFIERKEALLENEATRHALFDKKLAQEEVWIRKGIKARRTRNEGRVRALKKMREVRTARQDVSGTARIQIQESQISGKLVAEAQEVEHGFGDNLVIKNFSTTIMRKDRIGFIGPNGAGKTTLLNILLGKLKPSQGEIVLGTNLEVSYFDQLRAQLDFQKTVRENLAHGSDTISINGRSRHVMGYLQDFLFTPDRAMTPVHRLSGGEQNRLLLAQLFSKPSNLLVLDEPTNDLDEETLTLLEEKLLEYTGTLLVVSHDRAFLNNVVTSTFVFEGKGNVSEYIGGYDDWLRQRKPSIIPKTSNKKKGNTRFKETTGPKKLTFKERRELKGLPQEIDALEREQNELFTLMANPDFYKKKGNQVAQAKDRLREVEEKIKKLYQRWETLEKSNNSGE
jgi:ATP-binding cassette subfamily F protein uup